jgi:hypothetical protein
MQFSILHFWPASLAQELEPGASRALLPQTLNAVEPWLGISNGWLREAHILFLD